MVGKISVTGSGRITPDDEGAVGTWTVSEGVASVAIGQPSPATGSLQFGGAVRDEENGHYSEWAVAESATFVHEGDGGPSLGDYLGNVTSINATGTAVSGSVASILNLLNAERTMPTKGTYTQYTGQAVPNPADGNVVDMFEPGGIAFDSSGNMFLADRGNGRVVKYTETSGQWFYSTATAAAGGAGFGTGNGQFSSSGSDYRIAIDSSDRVLVTDPGNNRVQRFSNSLVYDTQFGSAGSGNGQFNGPYGIAVDSSDRVYVADLLNFRVQRFTALLAYDTKWGSNGSGTGQFSVPYALAIDSADQVYVTDGPSVAYPNVSRVQIFTASGTFVDSFDLRLTHPGAPTPFAYDISLAADDTIYIDELSSNTISRYTAYPAMEYDGTWGSYGDGPGQLRYARGLAVHPDDGRIFVSDFANDRVLIFTPGGDYTQPLSSYYQDYVDSCITGHVIDYQAADDPDVIYPGWTGNVWTKVDELAQANNQEVAVVGGVVTVRDVGQLEINPELFDGPPTIAVDTRGLARSVDIVYQNTDYGDGVVMYDAYADSNRILQIAAGKTETVTVSTQSYPVLVNNPVPVDTFVVGPGQYHVIGADDLPVVAQEWIDYGGMVDVGIGPTSNSINITLTGPTVEIPSVPGPYYLAASDGSSNYATLSISGAGVTTRPLTLHLYTGADPLLVTQEVSATITNIHISTEAQAYDRGVWASDLACGPNVTLTGSLDLNACEGFGLTSGSVIPWADSRYRIQTASINNSQFSITSAPRYVTSGDETTLWSDLPDITNLSENPSIEVSTAGFTAGTLTTLSRSNTWSSAGSWSLRLSTTGTGAPYASVGNSDLGSGVLPWGIVAGGTYTLSADVHSVHPGGGSWLADAGQIRVFYVIGSTTNGLLAETAPLDAFTVDARPTLTFTVPPNATGIRISFYATGIGTNWYAYWDSIMLSEGVYEYPFFDGDTSGASWIGTTGLSASTKAPNSAGDYAAFWNGEPAKNAIIRPLRTPE